MLASGVARAQDSCQGIIGQQKQKLGGPQGDTNSQPNLKTAVSCTIKKAGTYVFGDINILDKGVLEFIEPPGNGTQVDVWAKNIIIENGGTLRAGTATAPYGSRGGVLTIHLYGNDQSKGLDPNVDANQGKKGCSVRPR
jgi:hypothetical protein